MRLRPSAWRHPLGHGFPPQKDAPCRGWLRSPRGSPGWSRLRQNRAVLAKDGDPWPWSKNGKGITIFGEDGAILPEVWTILEILAASETILGTGHLSVAETHALVDAARQMGVKRILATHPEYMAPLSVDDQLALAKKGVFFERCFLCTTVLSKAVGGPLPFSVIVNNIRAVGVESTVLGTDFGTAKNIHPVAAMEEYQKELRQAGFKESEIETMAVKTPKRC